jgi:hypothetical protein
VAPAQEAPAAAYGAQTPGQVLVVLLVQSPLAQEMPS